MTRLGGLGKKGGTALSKGIENHYIHPTSPAEARATKPPRANVKIVGSVKPLLETPLAVGVLEGGSGYAPRDRKLSTGL